MSEEFVKTCGAECPGCACHISPPCSHCVEHLVDPDADGVALEFRAALCPVCHSVYSAPDGSPIERPPLCRHHRGFTVRTELASTPESARGVAKFATEHFLRSYRRPT